MLCPDFADRHCQSTSLTSTATFADIDMSLSAPNVCTHFYDSSCPWWSSVDDEELIECFEDCGNSGETGTCGILPTAHKFSWPCRFSKFPLCACATDVRVATCKIERIRLADHDEAIARICLKKFLPEITWVTVSKGSLCWTIAVMVSS